ncbi:MAG: hypothetical protein P8X70_02275 [Nanoarchaeota archaeon]
MKKGKTIAQIFAGLVSLCTLICCPSPIIPQNQPPQTEAIETNVKDDGTVEYTVSGTDDNSVKYIEVKINGEYYGNLKNGASFSVPIKEGENNIEARAYDAEDAKDLTPEEDSFYSPTQTEASEIIEQILNPNTYQKLDKNATLSFGNSEKVKVNALIRKINGTDAAIKYLSTPSDAQILSYYFVPNLCVPNRTSTKNLEDYVLKFQDRGYEGYKVIGDSSN